MTRVDRGVCCDTTLCFSAASFVLQFKAGFCLQWGLENNCGLLTVLLTTKTDRKKKKRNPASWEKIFI